MLQLYPYLHIGPFKIPGFLVESPPLKAFKSQPAHIATGKRRNFEVAEGIVMLVIRPPSFGFLTCECNK